MLAMTMVVAAATAVGVTTLANISAEASAPSTAGAPTQRGHRFASTPVVSGIVDAATLREQACRDASLLGYANGRLPGHALTALSWAEGHRLRPDAAQALERLNDQFRRDFGRNLSVTSTYRSYEGQHAARQAHGLLAADPGTSNHGWGIAVDLGGGIQAFDTPEHRWMVDNAPGLGWVLPAWAASDGGLPEPWHWEFHGHSAILVSADGPVEITPAMWFAHCMTAG